jgi:hypothetical protein
VHGAARTDASLDALLLRVSGRALDPTGYAAWLEAKYCQLAGK